MFHQSGCMKTSLSERQKGKDRYVQEDNSREVVLHNDLSRMSGRRVIKQGHVGELHSGYLHRRDVGCL